MNLPPRLVTPPPFSVEVDCDGRRHTIVVRDGELHATDHPLDEQVLEALGADRASGCRRLISRVHDGAEELAAAEFASLRHTQPRTGLFRPAFAQPTTATVPAQLSRLALLEQIVTDAEVRPDPVRYLSSRARWIADLLYEDGDWAFPPDPFGVHPLVVTEGPKPTVTIVDEWLASVFVLGLEFVNGVPISAIDTSEGELRLLSVIVQGDNVIPGHLTGDEITLPPGLRLL